MPVEGRTVVLGFVAEVEPTEGVLETDVPVFFVVADDLFTELDEPDDTRLTAPDEERLTEPEDERLTEPEDERLTEPEV